MNTNKVNKFIHLTQLHKLMDKCTCTFYQLKNRGFRPVNHAIGCPLYIPRINPLKEEWINKDDKIKYDEINKNRTKSVRKKM